MDNPNRNPVAFTPEAPETPRHNDIWVDPTTGWTQSWDAGVGKWQAWDSETLMAFQLHRIVSILGDIVTELMALRGR